MRVKVVTGDARDRVTSSAASVSLRTTRLGVAGVPHPRSVRLGILSASTHVRTVQRRRGHTRDHATAPRPQPRRRRPVAQRQIASSMSVDVREARGRYPRDSSCRVRAATRFRPRLPSCAGVCRGHRHVEIDVTQQKCERAVAWRQSRERRDERGLQPQVAKELRLVGLEDHVARVGDGTSGASSATACAVGWDRPTPAQAPSHRVTEYSAVTSSSATSALHGALAPLGRPQGVRVEQHPVAVPRHRSPGCRAACVRRRPGPASAAAPRTTGCASRRRARPRP